MKNSRFFRQLSLILGSGVMLLAFQNCAKSNLASSVASGTSSESVGVVTGATSQFNKITYDSNMELGAGIASASSAEALDVDLNSGLVTYRSKSGSKDCHLDVDREQKLKQILSLGRVCQARPPEGVAVCMAVGLADIKLSNERDSIFLRPTICYNGTYLCDGDDANLRQILADIIKNKQILCQ